jgi:hypothetical protein
MPRDTAPSLQTWKHVVVMQNGERHRDWASYILGNTFEPLQNGNAQRHPPARGTREMY